MTDVLIEFRHGLGDAVQLTAVLKHLRRERPDWVIDIAALPGKTSAFRGLCRRTFVIGRDSYNHANYAQRFALDWAECWGAFEGVPSTKVSLCLQGVFGIPPRLEDCRYAIDIGPEARAAADEYLRDICPAGPGPDGRYPVMWLHYQGNTAIDRKNLTADHAADACRAAVEAGLIPAVFDWDSRSPLPDQKTIFCPYNRHPLWQGLGTGDAERIAALIEASALMVGIDSGPLHVAGATSTPTIGVWLRHHPVHFFDPHPHVLHVVPDNVDSYARGPAAHRFFCEHYRRQSYRPPGQLSMALRRAILESRGLDAPALEAPPLLQELAGRYLYRRVGHDERPMRLEPDGTISEGAAGCEHRWFPRQTHDGAVMLDIFGEHGVICSCRLDGNAFNGAWTKFERMPIELIRMGD